MNTPTKITLIRILLLPVVIFFYMASFIPFGKILAIAFFLIAVLTDFLDGYLARKNNQVTVLGTFLDTIADKLLVISVLVLVVSDGTIPSPWGAIGAIIIIARELIVSAIRQLGASKNVIIAADMWGKVKANFQFFVLVFYMFYAYLLATVGLTTFVNIFGIITHVGFGATVLMTIVSGVHYATNNKEIFKENK